jgi:acetyl esterase/lipase
MANRSIDPSLYGAVRFLPNVDLTGWKCKVFRTLSAYAPEPPISPGTSVTEVSVPTAAGSVWIAQPIVPGKKRACVIWIHGGGHIVSSRRATKNKISQFAADLDAVVINPSYRLSPENPFPCDLEDNYQAMVWAKEHADELGIDANKFIVGGDSAGGGLAASVAQKARDEGFPLLLQVLNYPMLDDSTVTTKKKIETTGIALWTPGSNYYAWKSYLGKEPGTDEELAPYAVPARCKDLRGLAPAWIGCGLLDIFYDEDVAYAKRLKEAGVQVEWVELAGAYHGFDMVNPQSSLTISWRGSMTTNMAKAIKEAQ